MSFHLPHCCLQCQFNPKAVSLGAVGWLPVAISRGVSAFLLLYLKNEKALTQKPRENLSGHMPTSKPVTVMRDRITLQIYQIYPSNYQQFHKLL